jgi:hypothetical protein
LVSRTDEKSVTFSLRFAHAQGKVASVLSFDGTWEKLQQTSPIDWAMPVQGWRPYLLGSVKIKWEKSTILDYAAQSKPISVGTLGELRQSIIDEEAKAESSSALQETPANGNQ